jgi:hypothetical protein
MAKAGGQMAQAAKTPPPVPNKAVNENGTQHPDAFFVARTNGEPTHWGDTVDDCAKSAWLGTMYGDPTAENGQIEIAEYKLVAVRRYELAITPKETN